MDAAKHARFRGGEDSLESLAGNVMLLAYSGLEQYKTSVRSSEKGECPIVLTHSCALVFDKFKVCGLGRIASD
eukprot:759977-Hanusia_phi.AAC.10